MEYKQLITKLAGPVLPLLLLSWTPVQAANFCFAQAENYYEQIYCEVRAKGQGARLPSFNDFKQNPPLTQALLLKQPARKAGIQLAMPPSKKSPRRASKAVAVRAASASWAKDCVFKTTQIQCGSQHFSLTGNRRNSRLQAGALGADNKLGMAGFTGDIAQREQVSRYLSTSYRLYINKMLEIGLGGATMSYAKFAYIFDDLAGKGVDFAGRFETMFEFLKRDKRAIAVSEGGRVAEGVSLQDCDRLSQRLIVCTGNRVNHIYVGDK